MRHNPTGDILITHLIDKKRSQGNTTQNSLLIITHKRAIDLAGRDRCPGDRLPPVETYKTAKLASIGDEVKEMHPLLNILLPKLPRVEHVEHTHGEREKGADFVIARKDDTFIETEYIGVIAKSKKITQDYTDVERQIKECALPRTVFGGKKQIFLTEVWIMSTATISPNAQEKIQHEYNTRKIKFIPGTRLAELIDTYMPGYWTEIPLQIGEYLSRLWQANAQLDKQLSLLQVKDKSLYIDQDVFPIVEKKYRKQARPAKPINLLDVIENNKIILIEGGMGAGKSKLLRNAVDHYANPVTYLRKKLLPISVSYKDFADKYNGDAEKLINDSIDVKTRAELAEDNQYLLLIDGVDEKDLGLKELIGELSAALEAISKAQHVKVIITSRYLGEFEKNQGSLSNAARFELRPLSTQRLIEFIKSICEQFSLQSRIVEDLKKSALFKELPRSPIAAILLARLMQESKEELPSNMTELYSKYTELLLGRWDMEKGLQSQKEYEALDKILTRIATYMIENQLGAISLDEAEQIAVKYLDKRNLGIDSKLLFSKMLRRCELVCADNANNTLYFKHRTFADFFYARGMLKEPPTVDQRVFQIYWMNAFFFYVGLQKDCPKLLEKLIKLEPNNESQRWMKLINMPMYFLAGYTSEYEVIEKGITTMMQEASKMYNDVVTRKAESFLSTFSRMQLLCIMQSVVRKSYSYKFFKPALEHAALQIADNESNKEIASTALFFLSVTNIELEEGGENSFDFLLERYLEELPLEIQLGIKHEEGSLKERSDLLKKLDKRFSRFMSVTSDNKKDKAFYKAKKAALDEKMDVLYDRPIKLLKIT